MFEGGMKGPITAIDVISTDMVNIYPADYDFCRFASVLVDQITVIRNEMCV